MSIVPIDIFFFYYCDDNDDVSVAGLSSSIAAYVSVAAANVSDSVEASDSSNCVDDVTFRFKHCSLSNRAIKRSYTNGVVISICPPSNGRVPEHLHFGASC